MDSTFQLNPVYYLLSPIKLKKDGKKDKFMIYFILKTLLEILKEY